jgi:hypothetical protein
MEFKLIDVAPIMTFDGKPRPVPTQVVFKVAPTMLEGKPFHIIIFTKMVDGIQTLGGTNYWTPEELKANHSRVGETLKEKREFHGLVQQALLTGSLASIPTPTPQQAVPTQQAAVPTIPVLEGTAEAQVVVDEADSILDDLGI